MTTSDLQQRIAAINNKAELLLKRYQAIETRCKQAEARSAELEEQLQQLRGENERLNRDLEFMKIASSFVPQEGDIRQSKRFLQEIVWDIDKCIKQLSE